VIAKTLKDGPKDELASPRDVQGSRRRRLTSSKDAQRLLGERYMPPGRRHVFASFTSLNLHGDPKDVERRTGRFPDGIIINRRAWSLCGRIQRCLWKIGLGPIPMWTYCTISFNSAGIVTRDGPTKILVSADTYRFVTENNFGRSTLGAVTTVTFRYLEGARDAWLPNWMKWYSKGQNFRACSTQTVSENGWSVTTSNSKFVRSDAWVSQYHSTTIFFRTSRRHHLPSWVLNIGRQCPTPALKIQLLQVPYYMRYSRLLQVNAWTSGLRRWIASILRVPFMGFVLIWRSGCRFRRTGCNTLVSGYTIAGNYPTVTLMQVRRCNCCLSGYYGTIAGTSCPEWCHHFCSRLIM